MLFARDVVAVEDAFVSVLEDIPGTKTEKQEYFRSRGIRVSHTNYEVIWEALTARLEHGGAAAAVFELLQKQMPARLKELLRLARRGKPVQLRSHEPAIVRDFFFENGHLRRIGELFLEHCPAHPGRPTRPVAAAASVQTGKPYEIALSFAGEDRPFVDAVATELRAKGVRIFYDAFEPS